jgi:hypothetical protein
MLPPQQGRDDSLRARLAQGREANVPKPINAWGTERDDTIKGDGNNSTFPLPRGDDLPSSKRRDLGAAIRR